MLLTLTSSSSSSFFFWLTKEPKTYVFIFISFGEVRSVADTVIHSPCSLPAGGGGCLHSSSPLNPLHPPSHVPFFLFLLFCSFCFSPSSSCVFAFSSSSFFFFLSPPSWHFLTSYVYGFETVLLFVRRKVACLDRYKSVRHRMDASVFILRVMCRVCDRNRKKQTAPSFSCLELPNCEDACTDPFRAHNRLLWNAPRVPCSNCVLSWHKNVSISLILKFPLIDQMFRHNSTRENVIWGNGRLKTPCKSVAQENEKRNRLI